MEEIDMSDTTATTTPIQTTEDKTPVNQDCCTVPPGGDPGPST
jgi:hypothetical protein